MIVVWHTNRSWRQLCAGPGRMATGLPLASQFDEFARLFHIVADALNAMFAIAHYRSSSLPAPSTKCIDAVHLSPHASGDEVKRRPRTENPQVAETRSRHCRSYRLSSITDA